MKRFSIPFLLLCACFISVTAGAAQAQERILSFVSDMTLREDGSALVEETITVNAEHVNIRRGIYRDLPNSADEPVKFISLYMDGAPHPSFTEAAGGGLRINFGNDDYIPKGIRVYRLSYSVGKIARAFEDYDEIYWNVTGNDWDFTIERASFNITLPEGAYIKDSLVSMYTGARGSKGSDAVKTGAGSFETTRPLRKDEGFTVAIPFNKGIVKSYKKDIAPSAGMNRKGVLLMSAGILLFICFMAYAVLSWIAVGMDPKDVTVTEFSPPDGISPAFTRCLWRRGTDQKMFATALISLAMKDKITVTEEKTFFRNEALLKIKDKDTDFLPEEEKHIIKTLFAGGSEFRIAQSNWAKLSSCITFIEKKFNSAKNKYILSNKKYIVPAVIMLLLFQLLFIPFGAVSLGFIFINLHYSIFLLAFVHIPRNKTFKVIAFILLNLLYSLFFISVGKGAGVPAAIIEGCFLLSFWAFIVYISIIDNLTEEGRELFKRIRGFHRYMTIAEEHRVAASVPVDNEKIFADYLPYAFAFDMENKWMKRFEKVLSRATIDNCTRNIGGMNAFAGGFLVRSINSAAPRNSGNSGSGGGGFSGGGSGGGGGGGR